MKNLPIFLFVLLFFNCKNDTIIEIKPLTADEIVNKSISISGGILIENSIIRFDFRDKYYVARREKGKFSFVRIIAEENRDSIFDVLTNDNFVRIINGDDSMAVGDSLAPNYKASVNSVHYFSVLPYGLNDKAVNKELIGEERIKNRDYYKIRVTFDEEGGGEDFDDVFIYWINKQNFKNDYLAYSYAEEDGQGLRFREAYNERYVNGIRFVDYNNYKESDQFFGLYNLGKAFDKQSLKLLSKIELENVEVDLIDL
jgi:hypothetical protein